MRAVAELAAPSRIRSASGGTGDRPGTARDLSEWPDAPDGAEMCKQLGERGRPWPWRELLARVFEGTDRVRLHTQRHRSSGDPLVDSERVFHRRALITRRE